MWFFIGVCIGVVLTLFAELVLLFLLIFKRD